MSNEHPLKMTTTSKTGSARTAIVAILALLILCGIGAGILMSQGNSPSSSPDPSAKSAKEPTSPAPENPSLSQADDSSSQAKTAQASTTKDTEAGSDDCEVAVNDSLSGLEGFTERVDGQLKKITRLLKHPADIREEAVKDLVTDAFHCGALRSDLTEVFQSNQLVVQRATSTTDVDDLPNAGASGLAESLKRLAEPYRDASDIHVKFKTVRVEAKDDTVTSRAYFHASGHCQDRLVEQTSTWDFQWQAATADEDLRLTEIKVDDFEEVSYNSAHEALYGDATLAVMGDSPAFQKQLMYGIQHWRNQIQDRVPIDFRGHHGIAVGDVNNDGLEDFYLCQPNGLPNLLYVQNEDGTVRDTSAEAGVDWLDASKSALLIDVDNDGDQDLVVSVQERVLVLSNDGQGRFSLIAELEGPRLPHSMSAADFDNDGDLDIYVCGFWKFDDYKLNPLRAALYVPTPWHDANNGAPNHLFRNDGNFEFADVTEQSGLDENNTRFSHAASWEDFDNDGDQDLYVANDFGRNSFYRNDEGHFVDIAPESGVEDMAAGMSVSWADYDRDGWMDVYVSNMFSSAGGRITYHRKFQDRLSEEVRAGYRRHARGNTLFQNSAGKAFKDVSQPAAVVLGRWAWASHFMDMNNDGLEDIFVANGYVTNEDTNDL